MNKFKYERVLIDPSKKFTFFLILKNAHTAFEEKFLANNWTYLDNQDAFNFNYISSLKNLTILRDPYERWISGFVSFYTYELSNLVKRNKLDNPLDIPESFFKIYNSKFSDKLLEFVFNYSRLELDYHTTIQKKFVDKYDLLKVPESIVAFHFLPDVNITIQKYLEENNVIVNLDNKIVNPVDKKSFVYQKITNFIENNPKAKSQLHEYLKPDYDFISSVKFYNG